MEFILYSRSNCPLCEAMEEELRPFIKTYDMTVVRRYIDNEPELERLYGTRVPVLVKQDQVLCEYFLDQDKLMTAIDDELKKS